MPKNPVTPEQPADATPEEAAVQKTAVPAGGGTHPSGLTIIPSKIAPSTPGRSVMMRARLVGWFDLQTHARLIIISELQFSLNISEEDSIKRLDRSLPKVEVPEDE